MGIRDWFKKKPSQKVDEEKSSAQQHPDLSSAKHADKICSYCGNSGADRKWAGKYWHKSCLRAAKKEAKGYLR